MITWMPWKIARKELKVISRKRSIIFYTVGLPLLIAIVFSVVVKNQIASGIPNTISLGAESIIYIFVVLATVLPSTIAAYSIVGEKVEKTLEPLLATPTTDGEILLGKSIASFIPPILSTWAGASIFMGLADYILYNGGLGYYYFPNWNAAVMLLILAPLAAVLSIEIAVIASSRVSDVRGANQIAGLMFIPFVAVFFAGAEGLFAFSVDNLLIFSGIVMIADVILYFLSRATFRREEILTKWK
ncbi:MAG: ABC transporter permease subunit [Candidatus Bathyarchaeia archaeon]|jgi:ABC-type Na+ efflux pump permease subunit